MASCWLLNIVSHFYLLSGLIAVANLEMLILSARLPALNLLTVHCQMCIYIDLQAEIPQGFDVQA